MALSSSQTADSVIQHLTDDTQISTTLKFVVSNLRNFVTTPLQSDNYDILKSQIQKILRANGHFLDPASRSPQFLTNTDGSQSLNPLQTQWLLHDQNLSASICSMISLSVLPYVISLDSTTDLWNALENRFQATNSGISAAGSSVDAEEIIHHILNGLPHSYQSFKTAIRTMLTPLSLDQLYPLLLSKEINLASDAARAPPMSDNATALFTYRGRGHRPRGRNTSNMASQPRNPATASLYVPPSRTGNTALLASPETAPASWYLDYGASTYLTNSLDNLAISQTYQGQENITIGDGSSVGIANSGAEWFGGTKISPYNRNDQDTSPHGFRSLRLLARCSSYLRLSHKQASVSVHQKSISDRASSQDQAQLQPPKNLWL
ncbi:uncharacterized protein LOC110099927 [Dendrobium catenatum]|uniref:uncharacterized protein LOC110099927 n=1 Tax=Dendrobium catenatum TaxID=906689 RepID=UPI0009F2B409|nr:uncharacterized protein LOC110099927 [Dendrobium catenatum]